MWSKAKLVLHNHLSIVHVVCSQVRQPPFNQFLFIGGKLLIFMKWVLVKCDFKAPRLLQYDVVQHECSTTCRKTGPELNNGFEKCRADLNNTGWHYLVEVKWFDDSEDKIIINRVLEHLTGASILQMVIVRALKLGSWGMLKNQPRTINITSWILTWYLMPDAIYLIVSFYSTHFFWLSPVLIFQC